MEVATLPQPPVKEKRKNSEKRKEKSRDAARSRRSKESEIFSELASVLPLPQTVVSHLDKASIMRIIISNLKLYNLFKSLAIAEEASLGKSKQFEDCYLKASGGFVIVMSMDQDIIFISQNVSHYLGISQIDLLGQNFMDISHPCDHSEIRDLFAAKLMSERKSFFCRLKCVSSKGRGINTKSSSYKVLHTVGRFVKMGEATSDGYTFIALATPIPHPADIDIPLGKFTFLSKHSLDMKYTYADDRMEHFLGYKSESLVGKSLFEFHHVQDYKHIERAFNGLFTKGQFDTGQYRFLAQGGGYAWVSTQATLIYCEKNGKPQSVVCVNYVISGKYEEDKIYSCNQLEYKATTTLVKLLPRNSLDCTRKLETPPVKTETVSLKSELVASKPEQIIDSIKPRHSTRGVLFHATEEMTSGGFLTFQDDKVGSTSINDPDDLTYLAPEVEPSQMSLISKNGADDPLINGGSNVSLFPYRDEYSDGCLSPKLQSLQSPGSSGRDESLVDKSFGIVDEAEMRLLLGIDLSEEDLPCALTLEDNVPKLLPMDIPWSIDYSSTSGEFFPMDIKPEKGIKEIEKLLSEESLSQSSDQGHLTIGCDTEKRKRTSSIEQEIVKKRKQNVQDPGGGGSSVLMNLLIAGQDLNAGYVCQVSPRKTH